MKKLSIIPFLVLALLFNSCKKKDVPTSVNYNGTTLYFTSSKVAKGLAWGPYVVTGGASETDGKANTQAIVDVLGEGNYPAKKCADLVEGGFDDWYLPSIEELKAIASLEDDLPVDYTGTYWSSTELSVDQAAYYWIHYASQYNQFKNYGYDCLCVRKD